MLLIQTSPTWEDPVKSVEDIKPLLPNAGETDLVVLPEMFPTGFVTSPEGVAENPGGFSLSWMKSVAIEKGYAVAGSVPVNDGAKGYRNRFFFVYPDGTVRHYDKRHLFTYGGEHHKYTPGDERVIVEYMGFRILLQVCYDLRFPVFSRNRVLDGRPDYDMILYVASWPDRRVAAWDALLQARAIENVCYVAGVNRVGDDPFNNYSGHTTFINPHGEVVSICKENTVETMCCEVSRQELDEFRSSFPALSDAD